MCLYTDTYRIFCTFFSFQEIPKRDSQGSLISCLTLGENSKNKVNSIFRLVSIILHFLTCCVEGIGIGIGIATTTFLTFFYFALKANFVFGVLFWLPIFWVIVHFLKFYSFFFVTFVEVFRGIYFSVNFGDQFIVLDGCVSNICRS